MYQLCCVITGFGAAYGTAKSGVGIASMGVMRPELVMKSIVPVVMAGVLGIYGLIIAVIISTGSEHPQASCQDLASSTHSEGCANLRHAYDQYRKCVSRGCSASD